MGSPVVPELESLLHFLSLPWANPRGMEEYAACTVSAIFNTDYNNFLMLNLIKFEKLLSTFFPHF
jgi:hypothetical protein